MASILAQEREEEATGVQMLQVSDDEWPTDVAKTQINSTQSKVPVTTMATVKIVEKMAKPIRIQMEMVEMEMMDQMDHNTALFQIC